MQRSSKSGFCKLRGMNSWKKRGEQRTRDAGSKKKESSKCSKLKKWHSGSNRKERGRRR